jgi:hypothetical protein
MFRSALTFPLKQKDFLENCSLNSLSDGVNFLSNLRMTTLNLILFLGSNFQQHFMRLQKIFSQGFGGFMVFFFRRNFSTSSHSKRS